MNVLEKISSYNLITNLIPGAVLTEAFRAAGFPVVNSSSFAAWTVLAYMLGLVSNRLGALATKIKALGGARKNRYEDFVKASIEDKKLEILVETANGYRTFIGACIIFSLVNVSNYFVRINDNSWALYTALLLASLFIIFTTSYRRQNLFIEKRVRRICDGNA